MDGEGTYKYFKTDDIYSGTFVEGLKNGDGCYVYGADLSKFEGTWDKGVFVTGKWVLKGAGVYTGDFQNGKPAGPGSFAFANGITQGGEYEVKVAAEDEEAPPEDPVWKGAPVFSSVL